MYTLINLFEARKRQKSPHEISVQQIRIKNKRLVKRAKKAKQTHAKSPANIKQKLDKLAQQQDREKQQAFAATAKSTFTIGEIQIMNTTPRETIDSEKIYNEIEYLYSVINKKMPHVFSPVDFKIIGKPHQYDSYDEYDVYEVKVRTSTSFYNKLRADFNDPDAELLDFDD